MRYRGFSPLFDKNSRVLILGSFPSVISRREAFYYGNARNRFWSVLSGAMGEPLPRTVEEKKRLCLSHGIALWDVVESCVIDGSMDADIRECKTVDLDEVLAHCPVSKLLCNGATAYKLTKEVYHGDLPVIRLPSTSPANARFDEEAWREQLKNI